MPVLSSFSHEARKSELRRDVAAVGGGSHRTFPFTWRCILDLVGGLEDGIIRMDDEDERTMAAAEQQQIVPPKPECVIPVSSTGHACAVPMASKDHFSWAETQHDSGSFRK